MLSSNETHPFGRVSFSRQSAPCNQALFASQVHIWNGLKFRSKTEIKIAQELERVGVAFAANCPIRLLTPSGKWVMREPDFLICHQGNLGILEVDGDDSHPPSRTAEDHTRDRLFKRIGIPVVEHYPAAACWNLTEKVVADFLCLLLKSYGRSA